MSNKKLLAEIDRLTKKVNEGLDEINEIWSKYDVTDTPAQKEKLEAELKKEVKKLQRHRENIKHYCNNSEIKNKLTLITLRHAIERHMERFKKLEREIKTKEYSKHGLMRQALNSANSSQTPPYPPENDASLTWVHDQLEAFNELLDSHQDTIMKLEDEIDESNNSSEKKALALQIDEINGWVDQITFHLESLQRVYQGLFDDKLLYEQVDELKDGVEYFLESYTEQDFFNDENLYDCLNESAESIAKKRALRTKSDIGDSINSNAPEEAATSAIPEKTSDKSQKSEHNTKDANNASSSHPKSGDHSNEYSGSNKSTDSLTGVKSTISPPTQGKSNQSSSSGSTVTIQRLQSAASPTKLALSTPAHQPSGAWATPAAQRLSFNPSVPNPTSTNILTTLPSSSAEQKMVVNTTATSAPAVTTTTPSKQSTQSTQTTTEGIKNTLISPTPGSLQDLDTACASTQQWLTHIPPPQSLQPSLSQATNPFLPNIITSTLTASSTYQQWITQPQPFRNGPPSWMPTAHIISNNPSLTPSSSSPLAEREYPCSRLSPSTVTRQFAPAACIDNEHIYTKLSDETLLYITAHQIATPQHYLAAKQLKQRGWLFHTGLGAWCYRVHAPDYSLDRTEASMFIVYDRKSGSMYRGFFTCSYGMFENDLMPNHATSVMSTHL